LNADGIVDSADMVIMVDNWGTDNSLCDIGPTPFGDGIVDVEDLIVLAEHLFTYPGAIAYWRLDETEGDIAYDSVATNDAVVIGGALWQPDGGTVNGALAFDGADDYVSTDFVLNPMDGAFSVFAWIKGGAPGEVIISQTSRTGSAGSQWLCSDPSEGKLMAGLTHAVFPLKLYVDGAEVAKDNWRPLLGNDGGLYIGAGKNLESGSFFSGLIDDVRIYDRAVTP
ncbi:MAG: LamG-like jellyroll fold domain-containing protein, partial [Planctomycetota bacterium]